MEGGGEGAEAEQPERPEPTEPSSPEAPQEESRTPEPEEETAPAAAPEEVAPATPEETPGQPEEASAPADQPAPARSRAWLWAALVLVGAAIIGLVIGGVLGGRQGAPLNGQAGGNGRPTIVVGTAAVSPSAVANVPSPSPSAVVAGATAVSSSSTYVVKPGDTLRSIAEQEYGDASLWPKIYQANRDVIGADPDALVAGTTLQIPAP
jgi:resuscitation-promoting factor RpfA